MENKFTTKEDVRQWVEGLGLHLVKDCADDLTDKIIPVVLIQSDNDRDVGIFPVDFSPAFRDDESLVRWVNENRATVEYVIDVWDHTFYPDLTIKRLNGHPLTETMVA